jgi:hypothetical protein
MKTCGGVRDMSCAAPTKIWTCSNDGIITSKWLYLLGCNQLSLMEESGGKDVDIETNGPYVMVKSINHA